MISVNDLRNGTVFEWEGSPWKVLKYERTFQGRGRGKVHLRARNLKNASVRQLSFQSSDTVNEAEISRRKALYLYRTKEEAVFDLEGEKLYLSVAQIEWELNFLTKLQEAWILFFEDRPMSVVLPPTVTLSVKQTDPGVKGDTVSNTLKPATLETGLLTKVPLFIGEGEQIIVDTETGEYRGRA